MYGLHYIARTQFVHCRDVVLEVSTIRFSTVILIWLAALIKLCSLLKLLLRDFFGYKCAFFLNQENQDLFTRPI